MPGKGGEVVTRQPYRKVWLDHLLSKELRYRTRETVGGSCKARWKLEGACHSVFKDGKTPASELCSSYGIRLNGSTGVFFENE